MSEISQKMEFDASAAITTLANLDKAMQNLNATVNAAPAGFTVFNAKAGKTVAALKHLSSNAKTAAADLQKVISLQGRVSTAAPKQAPADIAKAAKPVKTPDLSSYIAQLQQMYKIAGSASKEQKRAFQTAITSAAEYAQRHKKTAADIASTNANMSKNMTGTADKMANALAKVSSKAKVVIPKLDTSAYVAEIQKLIPLAERATDAQKRNWQSLSTKIAESALKSGMSIEQLIAVHGKLGQSLTGPANKVANDMQRMASISQKAVKPVKTPDLSPYIAQLQQMYKIADSASKEQKRAFQAAITSAAEYAQKHKKTASDIASTNANMAQNMTGTANKMADALARISGRAKVVIPKPDTSKYVAEIQKLIPLSKKATDVQRRNWQSLSTKIAESALKSGMSIKQLIAIHGRLGQSMTGPANKVANDMMKMSKAGQKAVNGMTVSWQTMVRVMATQAIVRALSSIRTGLRAAIGDAVKFQRAIAEIGTIGRKLGDADAIGGMVQKVSDQFNVELADTAEAAYQTVSNQIASTEADVESFLGTAAKFSKVTKTDMATSVNLLSGVMNAFGKNVSEADSVAAKFFKTIELGRTRAEELEQGLGTVAPIADKLGISMEELNASVTTLTINGIQTDKAFTQIRGTMQGFLKPTTAMKKAMKELGFATGEQVLQAYNLQDAVKAVTATTDGNAAAIAKLFPRIRGLTGVLALVDDETQHFTQTLNEQKQTLQEIYDKAYELVIETPAEKVTKDLNKIKNFFTVEFGQSILEASVNFSDMIGSVDNLLGIFKSLASVLPQTIAGLTLVGTTMGVLAIQAALAKGKISFLNKALLAFVAAQAAGAAGKGIAQYIVDGWTESIEATKAGISKNLEARQLAAKTHISIEKTKIDEIIKLMAKGFAEQRKIYFQQVKIAQEANDEQIKDVKSLTDKMIAERQRLVNKLQSQVSSMGKNIVDSDKRAGTLRDQLDDQLFQRKISRESEHQQMLKLTQKSSELASNAVKKLSLASTEDERASADEEFQRAKAFADQALAIADGTDNRRLADKAMRHLESITEDLIDAEGRYKQNIARSAKALVKRTRTEERRVEKMKAKQKELLEAFSLTDKDTGELLPQAQRKEQIAKAQKTLREFIDLSGDPMDVATMLNYAGVSAQLAQELHTGRIQELVISTQALQGLTDDVSRALSASRIDSRELSLAEYLSGVEITEPVSEKAALDELQAKYDAIYAKKEAYLDQGNILISSQKELVESLKETKEAAKGASSAVLWDELKKYASAKKSLKHLYAPAEVMRDAPETALDKFSAVLDIMDEMAVKAGKGIHIDPQAVDHLSGALTKAATEAGAFETAGGALGKVALNAEHTVLSLKKVAEAQQGLKKSTGDSTIAEVNQEIARLEVALKVLQAPEIAAKAISTSLGTAKQNITEAVEPSASLRNYWNSIRADAERAAAAATKMSQTGGAQPGADDQAASLDQAKMSADQLQLAMGGVKMDTEGSQTAQDGHTAAVNSTQSAVGSLIASYGQLLSTIRAAASAQASLSTGAVTAAKGGPIGYFASGGRGTDTIPAMLSEGEFVTNAKSSRRFFSQLQAMNAGRTPVYRESGGSTTNIGDVSISVNESSSPRQTGREVMQAFRREMRRGSGRI